MYKFVENYTPLRELNVGDIYLTKSHNIGMYIKNLGDDKHLIKNIDTGNEYVVPHGRFPVFKMINQNKDEN